MIRVISISTDRKIFEKGSAVRARMIEYGSLFKELHIIVLSLKNDNGHLEQIAPNVLVYPTFSRFRLAYLYDAFRLAKIIIKERNLNATDTLLMSQDPFETGLIAVLLKKATSFRLQIQIHTDFLTPHFKNGFLNSIRYYMAKYVIQFTDRIRVVSNRIKNSLIKIYKVDPKKIDILPIFINLDDIRLKKIESGLRTAYPKFDFRVLLVSRLEKEKNIKEVLEIVSHILTKHPKVGFIIIGDGRERTSLEAQAQRLKITQNVVFEGWNNDPISYMKTADVFLVNSTFEGYGMTIIEAVTSGCPVITTDVGIAKEYIFDGVNGYVCKVGDGEGIRTKLEKLIQNPKKYSEIKKKTVEMSQKMTSSKYTYLDNYRQIAEKTLER